MGSQDMVYDCIVIGGGFAGLSAGLEISRRSSTLKTLIIESQERLGGRAKTETLLGSSHPIDLGCSFIHGYHQGNPMNEFAKAFNVDVVVVPPQEIVIVGSDGPLADKETGQILESFDKVLTEVKESLSSETMPASHQSLARSLNDHLNSRYSGREFDQLSRLTQTLEVGAGIPLDQVSSRYFGFHRPYSGSDGAPVGGYEKIVSAMVRRVKEVGVGINLKEEVKKLTFDHQSGLVSLETIDQMNSNSVKIYRTRACISTIPLGVMKHDPPIFDPPLERPMKSAIESTTVGLLNKVVLIYDSAWWPNPISTSRYIFLGDRTSDDQISSQADTLESTLLNTTFWADNLATHSPVQPSQPTLIIPLGAIAGQAIERYNDQEVVETIHHILTRRFQDPNLTSIPPPKSFAITRWGSNRYARGATSSPVSVTSGVDTDHRSTPLNFIYLSRSTWEGHLGFAGEHTHLDHRGSVAGAILSGQREAKRVIQLLSPPSGH